MSRTYKTFLRCGAKLWPRLPAPSAEAVTAARGLRPQRPLPLREGQALAPPARSRRTAVPEAPPASRSPHRSSAASRSVRSRLEELAAAEPLSLPSPPAGGRPGGTRGAGLTSAQAAQPQA